MDRRLALQTNLETVLGSKNVYFQPPPNVNLSYPCIVYKRARGVTRFASNVVHQFTRRYQVELIDPDPDSAIIEKLACMQSCVHANHFANDGLNHDIFELYL
jgi:hypothetical protein